MHFNLSDDFAGRTVIVTGATSGIGRSAAQKFSMLSANVCLVARDAERLQTVERELIDQGGACLSISADLTTDDVPQTVCEQAVEHFGQVDILVNAAGIIKSGTIADTTLAAWDEMLNINLRAVFNLMQACVPALKATHGNIVNVSSVTGARSFPGVLTYCVSKAALDQLTRCAALELAPHGVRVNAVNPGVVVTELHRRSGMTDESYENFLAHSQTTHPLGRVGTPDEVADLICYLAAPRAAWITGVTYQIDGGRANTCAR